MTDDPHWRPLMIVLQPSGDGYEVFIDPPRPNGNLRQFFALKMDALEAARAMWSEHRCGFVEVDQGRERA